jgi:hypothetical protein
MRHIHRHRFVAIALVAGSLIACGGSGGGGGNGPTAPAGPQATLATPYGTVTVFTNGNAFDPNKALAAIENGYAKARNQVGGSIDRVSLDGMAISMKPGTFNGAVGQYHAQSDLIEVALGVENVITHELQHRFCHRLGHSGDCCTYQDHSGGYDLSCKAS